MEALIAVGLAGNVVQFVSFSGKLLSEANAIRKTGSPSSLEDLRSLADNLNEQAGIIHKRLSTNSGSPSLAQEDQNLIAIAADCEKAGLDFLSYVDALIRKHKTSNPLKSIGVSIKFQFIHEKIDNYASKLDRLRSALTLATVLAFRASSITDRAEIIKQLQDLQKEQSSKTVDLQDSLRLLVDTVQTQAGSKLDALNERMQRCLVDLQKLNRTLPLEKEEEMLNWLTFRQMSWRYEEIPEAYARTFKWILQTPRPQDNWNDFLLHLESDASDVYFINGKAGSGKSTLMKYVVDNPKAIESLHKWAATDSSELLIPKFFFWNMGTVLQKSTLGLLRALLYKIVRAHPELLPVAFPELYHTWNMDTMDRLEPSYVEVKRAWRSVLAKSKSFLKLAIFIDGLDEFDGDHRDLCEFIKSLVSPHVKIVVSSRPINACLNAFHDCPSLSLQDLTKTDMDIFVSGTLASHTIMRQVTTQHPDEASKIVAEIKEKACGVFLWVKLVVRLLVDGLEAGDNVNDLINTLHSLPSDLRLIYRRMIGQIHPTHQMQAAEIFQLLQVWQSHVKDAFKLSVLHFALQPPETALQLSIGPLKSDKISFLSQQVTARVRSRCCGLLEVHDHVGRTVGENHTRIYSQSMEDLIEYRVTYLHRTVAEFLQSDDVSLEMQKMTGPTFEPYEILTAASLSALKVCGSIRLRRICFYFVKDMIKLYQEASSHVQENLEPFLAAMGSVMTTYQMEPYEGQLLSLPKQGHWSEHLGHDDKSITIPNIIEDMPQAESNLLARIGAHQYLSKMVHQVEFRIESVIVSALLSWQPPGNFGDDILPPVPLHSRRDTLLLLVRILAKRQDPQAESRIHTVATQCASQIEDEEKHILFAILVTELPFGGPELAKSAWPHGWGSAAQTHPIRGADPLTAQLCDKLSEMLEAIHISESLSNNARSDRRSVSLRKYAPVPPTEWPYMFSSPTFHHSLPFGPVSQMPPSYYAHPFVPAWQSPLPNPNTSLIPPVFPAIDYTPRTPVLPYSTPAASSITALYHSHIPRKDYTYGSSHILTPNYPGASSQPLEYPHQWPQFQTLTDQLHSPGPFPVEHKRYGQTRPQARDRKTNDHRQGWQAG